MQWLIEHKDLFEVLSYLSVIIGSAAAVFAAFQIYYAKESVKLAASSFDLAKTDSHIRLKREAIVIAAERCEQFAREILPFLNANVEEITRIGISNEAWQLENHLLNESSIKDWDAANEWLAKLRPSPIGNDVVRALNILESFAIYFVKGAADEQVAFPSIGVSFCLYINKVAPYLILLRQKKLLRQASGPFQNIAALYSLWSDRLNKEALQLESNKINEKLSQIHSAEIPPVGL